MVLRKMGSVHRSHDRPHRRIEGSISPDDIFDDSFVILA